ncbi:MAG: hypothetical protein IPP42_20725 [Saprospiraceae bacterium]|nr:hypothetical protein [Saprospiraceae bacterium]
MIDLFTNYKQDLGMGFNRSMYDLFRGLSACFTLICILGGWVNLYFLKNDLSAHLWKGLLKIEIIVFGALFLVMLFFTFLPPIVLTGLIFTAAIASRYLVDTNQAEAQ